MSNSTLSPNMGLVLPTVGVDPGPDWATNLNASLSIIDTHNHSTGQGNQIQPNGLNINSDLSFLSNNATNVKSVRFSAQNSPISNAGSDVGCLYVSGNEIYYNDVTGGHQVQITNGGSVNAGAGSITGLPSGTASATFSAGTFTWQSATATPANLDAGSVVLRNNVANSKGLTLQAPGSMANNYSLTLPSLPGSSSLMAIDTSGNITAPYSISGGLSGSVLASGTVTGTQMASNVNLPGNAVQENGQNVVVSNTNDTTSLSIVRGQVTNTGTVGYGVGFSVSLSNSPVTNAYTVTFTTPFASAPIVTANVYYTNNANNNVTIYSVTASGFVCQCLNSANNPSTINFGFIAIGPR